MQYVGADIHRIPTLHKYFPLTYCTYLTLKSRQNNIKHRQTLTTFVLETKMAVRED